MTLRQSTQLRDVPALDVCPSIGTERAPETMFVHDRMGAIPRRWLPRLRQLSLGSEEGAMVRWSYHDGSTWAIVLFEGTRRDPKAIVGWSVFTLQEAEHPIIGVYVDDSRRGFGYGVQLVTRLLDEHKHRARHGKLYAVADWWPKYTELIAAAGLKHLEWD